MLNNPICIYCGKPMKLVQVTTPDDKKGVSPLHNYFGCEDCHIHIPLSTEQEKWLLQEQEAAGQLRLI